jgi:uncharacterized protein (TIGR02271 family)
MQGVSVVRDDGSRGTVIAGERPGTVVVQFDDGSRLHVPSETLVAQQDGTYFLARSGAEEMVIPIVEEELTVETYRLARGKVRVNKRIETREEVVDTPVVHEEVVVEHVPVNKFVDDAAPEVRNENGVLIIPLIEEILVVEKRLFVREEVRVSTRRTTTNTPQTVVLRREVVDIEREDSTGTPADKSDAGG